MILLLNQGTIPCSMLLLKVKVDKKQVFATLGSRNITENNNGNDND